MLKNERGNWLKDAFGNKMKGDNTGVPKEDVQSIASDPSSDKSSRSNSPAPAKGLQALKDAAEAHQLMFRKKGATKEQGNQVYRFEGESVYVDKGDEIFWLRDTGWQKVTSIEDLVDSAAG